MDNEESLGGEVLAAVVDELAALITPPPWYAQAACRGLNPDMFFPERGESVREVKAVCAVCPVRVECDATATARNERFGIWGGRSERARLSARRAARRRTEEVA